MGQIKMGILGAGTIAERSHIPGCRNQPDVELVAICDANLDRARAVAERHNIPHWFSNPDEMLALNLDAVTICTPNITHVDLGIKALEAGKHILIDKPPTTTASHARKLRDLAASRNLIFMPLFNNRFRSEVLVGRDIILSGQLDEPYYARTACMDRRGATGGWLADPQLAGGGAVMDLGVHHLDYTLFLLGYPKAVSVYGTTYKKIGSYQLKYDYDAQFMVADMRGRARPSNWAGDVEEMGVALVKFDTGLTLLVETAWAINAREDIWHTEIYGAKGGLKVDPPPVMVCTDEGGYLIDKVYDVKSVPIYPDTHSRAIRHFVDCIKGEATPLSTGQQAVQIMEIIEGIYQSRTTDQVVHFDRNPVLQ